MRPITLLACNIFIKLIVNRPTLLHKQRTFLKKILKTERLSFNLLKLQHRKKIHSRKVINSILKEESSISICALQEMNKEKDNAGGERER